MMTLSGYSPLFPCSLPLFEPRTPCRSQGIAEADDHGASFSLRYKKATAPAPVTHRRTEKRECRHGFLTAKRSPSQVTESLSAVQPVIAISELPFPSIDIARTAQIPLLRVPYPAQCSGRDPEAIRPLAMHAEAWEAIPGVSEWVLNIVKRGYSLQFARRPPRFRARTETRVNTEAAHLLHTDIAKLLRKGR
ncbi:hypothetical protein PO909_000232 [Leuciscus waleckii]